MDRGLSFRIWTASLIHLVDRSDSLSVTDAADQLITWFSWTAWSVSADLLLERKLSATVSEDLRPKLSKRYVDDTLEVVKRGTVDKLTEFLNNLDDSGSIKFTYEVETEGQLPFLDLLLKRTNSGGLKLSVLQETYPHWSVFEFHVSPPYWSQD